ncbi:MAG: hypothetical protein BWX80_02554 [Candidatus Hydrogenedentes bacterium ADurb.Bin101]|nr:MAG: hypothetical protein BWX80_02554 [Candidatus Hydrogenedentes bacterium ADurb.Bin101]
MNTLLYGKGRTLSRFTHFPFDRPDQRRFFAAHKSARALHDLDIETKLRSQDMVAEHPLFIGLFQGGPHMRDGQRVFIPYIQNPLGRPGGISANQHSFQNTVGIAFQNTAVHVGTGVAFIRVTHEKFMFPPGLLREQPPLDSRGKSCPTAPAQPGARHLFHHPSRVASFQNLDKGSISPIFNITFHAHRIDFFVTPHDFSNLLAVKRQIFHACYGLPRIGIRP